MTAFRRGDIVLVPFPFTDLTATKVRPAFSRAPAEPDASCPALVVSADPQGSDFTLAFVSSVVPASAGTGEVVLDEDDPAFPGSGLKRASVFRTSKLVTLNRSLVARRLGRVTQDVQACVDEGLRLALGLSG